jgi:tetratricopeptide (TPR) repeat protein
MSKISNYRSTRVAFLGLAILTTAAVPCTAEELGDGDCAQLHSRVVDQVAKGERKEAEAALSKALINSSNQAEGICAGLISGDLAAIMLDSGRPADAETFAEQSLSALGSSYPPNAPILLHPLQVLCSARFQQGKIGAARQVFERMRSIPAGRPEDRALVHRLHAALLVVKSKYSEAETEYLAVTAALEQAGRLQTSDAATNFAELASLYIRQQRYEDARKELDRAWELLTTAKDAVSLDLINLLDIRAILHVRLAQWTEAERDLLHAISLADHERQMDPRTIEALLTNYAVVLRKTHRRHEARHVEARLAALQNQQTAVVDVSELLQTAKHSNRR